MRAKPLLRLASFCVLLAIAPPSLLASPNSTPNWSRQERTRMAGAVRQEFLHAWTAYKRYAWGHDELQPLSKTSRDWYGTSLMMPPVDALDTMIVMDLKDEADQTRKLIDE